MCFLACWASFANIQGPEARLQVSVYSKQVQVSGGQGFVVNAKMECPPPLPNWPIPIWGNLELTKHRGLFFGTPFVIVLSFVGSDCQLCECKSLRGPKKFCRLLPINQKSDNLVKSNHLLHLTSKIISLALWGPPSASLHNYYHNGRYSHISFAIFTSFARCLRPKQTLWLFSGNTLICAAPVCP